MYTMIFILNRLIQDFRGIKLEDFILNDRKFYIIFFKIIKNYFKFYFYLIIWIKHIIKLKIIIYILFILFNIIKYNSFNFYIKYYKIK